jgi:hypothetical protein
MEETSMVLYSWNPRYLGGRRRRFVSSRAAWTMEVRLYLKIKVQKMGWARA